MACGSGAIWSHCTSPYVPGEVAWPVPEGADKWASRLHNECCPIATAFR